MFHVTMRCTLGLHPFYDIQRYPPSTRFSISGRVATIEPTYTPLITRCSVTRSLIFRPDLNKIARPRRTSGAAAKMRSHVQFGAQHLNCLSAWLWEFYPSCSHFIANYFSPLPLSKPSDTGYPVAVLNLVSSNPGARRAVSRTTQPSSFPWTQDDSYLKPRGERRCTIALQFAALQLSSSSYV